MVINAFSLLGKIRDGKISLSDQGELRLVAAFKKLHPTDKANFLPVSLLPTLPKVFEKVIYDQFNEYVETFLNKLFCVFCKEHSTQHALVRLLLKEQKELHSSGIEGTFLMSFCNSKIGDTWACHKQSKICF